MRPIRLTINAFGSYRDQTTVDFTKPAQDFFLITGDTGAGKTTIFDAIVFALYGEASSTNNKKDGYELQSQYALPEEEPFVELEFSETVGEEENVYTVRRTPRYVRPLKIKSREGFKEVSERVSLTLPDGREYAANKKEVDAKLEEIVGLTKDQFMQVAMIAQGEFMELLRASSDTKKVIFRKLFGTKLYQDVAEELLARRKELEQKMAQIRTVCQTYAAQAIIPEDDKKVFEIRTLQKKIREADRFSVTDTEAFILELERICEELKEKEKETQTVYDRAAKERDRARDAWTNGGNLKKLFDQLETAETELKECAATEEEMKEAKMQASRIENAYEIRACFIRFEDAKVREDQMRQQLKELQESRPALEEKEKEARAAFSESKKLLEQETERFTRVSERVSRALETFEKIRKAEKEIKDKEVLRDAAVKEQKEQEEKRKKAIEEALLAYQRAKQTYQQKNEEFQKAQASFYDHQAGLLAAQLVPGEPCPVCGSIEHPNPCKPDPDEENITREMLDFLSEEVQGLQDKMSQKAEEAQKLQEKPLEDEITKKVSRLETELAAEKASLAELKKALDYSDEKEARQELRKAREAKEEKEEAKNTAEDAATKARTEFESAKTLITQITGELPKLEEDSRSRKSEYEELCLQKSLPEEQWKTITEMHEKSVAESLKQKAAAHENKKTAAAKMSVAAKELIGGQPKPDMEALELKKSESEEDLKQAQAKLTAEKEMRKTDTGVLIALTERKEEREGVLKQYSLYNGLYNRIAGKIPGARMDMETYVQRYYLNRILHAANLRFREMSAGQYELRMRELEKAGEGKNHGLDLMVYSAVTGKEREIRTLSGGESFMAALCLALGLSDQICESSASVHLDILFIDEGFGSLDENARAQAVRILKTMAGSSKMVGVISHVSELKQEVEDQLIVEKDETGSHIRWQIR